MPPQRLQPQPLPEARSDPRPQDPRSAGLGLLGLRLLRWRVLRFRLFGVFGGFWGFRARTFRALLVGIGIVVARLALVVMLLQDFSQNLRCCVGIPRLLLRHCDVLDVQALAACKESFTHVGAHSKRGPTARSSNQRALSRNRFRYVRL